jgi:hypothetical protein
MGAARCYEKLGQMESSKLYEQVMQTYPDQADQAGAARERLAAMLQGQNPPGDPQAAAREAQLAKLNDQLTALDRQYTEMSAKYTPQHPEMVSLTKQIGEVSRALQMEAQRQGMISIAPGMFARKRTDSDELVKFTGIVKEIQLINPNVWITVDVENAKKKRSYRVKGTNPRSLVGTGLGALKQGDTVTVEGLAKREDPLTIGFATLTTADGQKFFLGNSNFP